MWKGRHKMLERSKWQKELSVFSKLVNTIVLTGNVNDQHAIINEREQRLQGFCSLELYLAKTCQNMGYQAVLFYNPVEGFHNLVGLQQRCDVMELLEKTIAGEASIPVEGVGEAARVMNLVMTKCEVPIAIVVSFSSRIVARPDDLDMDERMTFMYLQEASSHARKNTVGENEVLQNKLFLIADKMNDLPAWYYLSHPGLKDIYIPKPDYRMRGQIIEGYSVNFPGYSDATVEERQSFIDTFVGSTEGFMTQDIARVFQIAKYGSMDIHSIDKAILLYKHGVQDNPWLKLDSTKLLLAEDQIRKRVLGQDPVIKAAVDIVKRAAMGMSGLQHSSSSSKPRGILFLAGPTGTGKTELAKALTELIFLDERNMIRFDMSEYRQEQSDQRLLGAPPGYVGYEAGGQLTNAIREHPFSVLLFDEIEKAHPSVMDKFLQILEDGRITDGRGETVYFQDCLIIFTSNLGITVPSKENPSVRVKNVSFEEDQDYETVRDKILDGVRHYFNDELGRPELLNRIGNNILVFDYIRESSLKPILAKQIKNISKNLWADKHIKLCLSPRAEEDLYQFALADLPKGQGGRGIGNMMEEMLINPLARFLFDQCASRDSVVTVEHIYKQDGVADIKAKITE